jgi:hypothetical protein
VGAAPVLPVVRSHAAAGECVDLIVGEFLSTDELKDLTQRARKDAQARMLESAGIPFRWLAGRLVVSRHHAREWLAGRDVAPSREPDMGAIR